MDSKSLEEMNIYILVVKIIQVTTAFLDDSIAPD